MAIYARVENGVVMEIIEPMVDDSGAEIKIVERFTPEFVSTLVDATNVDPKPACWWTFDGKSFVAPA